MQSAGRDAAADHSGPGSEDASTRTLHGDHENTQNSGENHGLSKEDGGEAGDGGSPREVGFWDSSLNKVRWKVFGLWLGLTILLSTFILGILSLYWAVLFDVNRNLNSFTVNVVNFETDESALVGPLVVQTTQQTVESSQPHLGYTPVPPTTYDNDPMRVREAVYEKKAWAAIIVNSNATALLRAAVEQGNSSYDPLGACQIIYVEARDQTSFSSYITPQLTQLQNQIVSQFSQQWTTEVMRNTSISRESLVSVPQALNPAIGFSMFNLRPFTPPAATPTVTIGLIYLIIISFFSFSFFLPVHHAFLNPSGHPPLKFNQLVLWRWVSTITFYLILSLVYSLVSLAFQIPFHNDPVPGTVAADNPTAFGRGSFPVYWMVNFWGMNALGLACENAAMVVGFPWSALWLIFWVITNVSTSFYPIDTSPGFFKWGYAWPLYNVVEASRTVIFDLHSELGINFGVLVVWAVVNTAFFPLCCWFLRWKQMREKRKAQ